MMPPYKFLISIVSHNDWTDVRSLLLQLSRIVDNSVFIVVTVNVPEQIDDDFVFEACGLDFIHNSRPKSFAENHNLAFKMVESEYFLVCNPDIKVFDLSFKDLVGCFQANPNLKLLSPSVLGIDGNVTDFTRNFITPPNLISRYWLKKKSHDKFYWLCGMFLVFQSKYFDEVGGFDQKFRLYCEDFDICLKFFLKGFEYGVCSNITVVHEGRRGSHSSLLLLLYHVTSLAKLFCSSRYLKSYLIAKKAGLL